MSDVKARYTGDSPDGVTLGVILEDGDIYPYHVPHGGELPKELDGRKVSKQYRDNLLTQDTWTDVHRTSTKAEKTPPSEGK